MAPKGAPGGDAGKTMPVSGLARDGGIGLQEWLDGLDPEALATVYQGTMLRSAT